MRGLTPPLVAVHGVHAVIGKEKIRWWIIGMDVMYQDQDQAASLGRWRSLMIPDRVHFLADIYFQLEGPTNPLCRV